MSFFIPLVCSLPGVKFYGHSSRCSCTSSFRGLPRDQGAHWKVQNVGNECVLNSHQQDTVVFSSLPFSLVHFLEDTGQLIGEVFWFSLAHT